MSNTRSASVSESVTEAGIGSSKWEGPSPSLPEIVAVLKREGKLKLPPETERPLVQMNPATIDRLLHTHRPRSRCTTKLVKDNIPDRIFADWDDARLGFLGLNPVAHCGESTAGESLHTSSAVDVATGWRELEVLSGRSGHQ